MTYKSLIPCVALAAAGFLASCGGGNDNDFVTLDKTWDSTDNVFNTEYMAVRAEHDRMTAQLNALAADSTKAAQAAEARTALDAHNKMLQDMETARTEARTQRDAARTAKNRVDYDAARQRAAYDSWRAELERIRTEQKDLEGRVFVGSKEVGGVDVNVKGNGDPLVRVEPGKPDTNTLIRVEPGKEDNKPLIEKNKNP